MRVPERPSRVWLDGVPTSPQRAGIPLHDPACHVGLAVFETLAVEERKLLDLAEHLERLEQSADRLAVPLPPRERIREVALEAAAAEPAPSAWLKILATRGGRWMVFSGPLDRDEQERPSQAVLLPWRRNLLDPLCGVKSISYAHNELGLEEARRRGADEGLWLNTRGHLAEGCTSNLFVVRGRTVFTPALGEGLLAGVVRGLALRAAKNGGFTVHEGRLRVSRLQRANEAFLTSSLRGVRPLVRFEGRPVGRGAPGPVTAAIAGAVRALRSAESQGSVRLRRADRGSRY